MTPPVTVAVLTAYRVATTMMAPLAWWGAWASHRHRKGPPESMAQKMGRASAVRASGRLLWLHGNALGEVILAKPILDRILLRWPDMRLLVTKRDMPDPRHMTAMFPQGTAFQSAPLNIPAAIDRFYAHWRPDFVLWVKKNPTANYTLPAGVRGFAVIGAGMGAGACARRRRLLSLYGATYGGVDLFGVRAVADGERFRQLGAAQVVVVGDLRLAADPLPVHADVLADLCQRVAGRPLWVLASAGNGEDALAARVHRQLAGRCAGLLTIVAPRFPLHGPAHAATAMGMGLRVARRGAGELPTGDTDVYVADTLGELGLWYRLCPIAVVGGSFFGRGGHNLMEPTRLGCATLTGPSVDNVAPIAAAMTAAGALQTVTDADSLAGALAALIDDPDRLAHARTAAQAFARSSAHATEHLFDALLPHLQRALGPPR